jgi:hypothetical protein
MAVIGLHDHTMKVVHRCQGVVTPERFLIFNIRCVQVFRGIMEVLDPGYVVERAEKAERDFGRTIRNQQDEAYQKSLEVDRVKVSVWFTSRRKSFGGKQPRKVGAKSL